MNETAAYLDQFARTTADVRVATVEARNDDETYNVRYIDTQALDRAAKANPVDEFALGSRVLVQLPSGSRAVVGANPVIVSRAPREQRGLSDTTPATTRDAYTAPAITGTDPDPLILERGGAAQQHVIMGFGFDGAATYTAEVGEDPAITNQSAPVVTATKVTMNIRADADSPLGVFTVNVAGVKAQKVLQIVDPDEPPAYPILWALGYVGAIPHLIKINAETMEFVDSLALSVSSTTVSDLFLDGDAVVIKMADSLMRVARADMSIVFEDSAVVFTPEQTTMDHLGAVLYYGEDVSLNTKLRTYDAAEENGEVLLSTIAQTGNGFFTSAVDGATLWITNGTKLLRVTRATGAYEAHVAFTLGIAREMAHLGDHVYVVHQSAGGYDISQVLKADMSVVAAVNLAAGNLTSGYSQLRAHAGNIYGTITDGGTGIIFRATPDPFEVPETVSLIGRALSGFCIGDGSLFVADQSGGITVVSASTMSGAVRHAFDFDVIDRVIYDANGT